MLALSSSQFDHSFHLIGLDGDGALVPGQKWSRGQVEARLVRMGQGALRAGRCFAVDQVAALAFALDRGNRG